MVVLDQKPIALEPPRIALEPEPAIATMISKAWVCLRTSTFVHRSADRTNVPADVMASRRYIVVVWRAQLACQSARKEQCRQRKQSIEFALSSSTSSMFNEKMALAPAASLSNLVTVGRKFDHIYHWVSRKPGRDFAAAHRKRGAGGGDIHLRRLGTYWMRIEDIIVTY